MALSVPVGKVSMTQIGHRLETLPMRWSLFVGHSRCNDACINGELHEFSSTIIKTMFLTAVSSVNLTICLIFCFNCC